MIKEAGVSVQCYVLKGKCYAGGCVGERAGLRQAKTCLNCDDSCNVRSNKNLIIYSVVSKSLCVVVTPSVQRGTMPRK